MINRNLSLFLLAPFAVALLASYYLAPSLPISFGWENGPVENAQAILLFLGGIWALFIRSTVTDSRHRAFWLMVSPIWFIMATRELSWGAVFYPPLDFSALEGPTFSSSIQLWYKPAVPFVVAAILAGCIWTFVKTRQSRTVNELRLGHGLPLYEILMFIIAMTISAIAEGHMGMSFAELGKSGALILEELAEFWGYFALILAQWRVSKFLKPSSHPKM